MVSQGGVQNAILELSLFLFPEQNPSQPVFGLCHKPILEHLLRAGW